MTRPVTLLFAARAADWADYAGPLAAALAVFQHLHILGARHAVFVLGTLFFRLGPPQHQQLADVLDGRSMKLVGQLAVDRLARRAVVAQHADLDQAVGVQRRVGFLQHRGRQAVVADHDHGVQVVRLGAVRLAFGGGEFNVRHGRHYRCRCGGSAEKTAGREGREELAKDAKNSENQFKKRSWLRL